MKWTPEADAALQDLKAYLSSVPTLVAPKPQEPLLLYLAATNQVVSVALVAQRELEGEAAVAAELSDDGPRPSPAGLALARRNPRQGLVPARRSLRRWAKLNRRRWCSTQFILSVPSCRGLGQGILVCRSYFSASSWPRESCATISKHMRSPSSRASHCNESCTTQMQLGGLWSGRWSYRALASSLKALRQSRVVPL